MSDVKKSERYDNSMKNYSNKFYTSISYKEIKLDLYKFIGMELSMSTAPTKDDKLYKKYIEDLTLIYNKYAINDKIIIVNKTTAFVSNNLLK